jgi:hypothetical protein
VNHARIYVELLDTRKLHFTSEDCLSVVCRNKHIFEELAELLCSEKTAAPMRLSDSDWLDC